MYSTNYSDPKVSNKKGRTGVTDKTNQLFSSKALCIKPLQI